MTDETTETTETPEVEPKAAAPEAAAPAEAEATPEPEAPAEGEPEAKDEEPKKDEPPSLKAARRLEKKAKDIRDRAEAKMAAAEQRAQQAEASIAAHREQVRAWEAKVQPQLRELQALKAAVAARDYTGIFESLGLDPKDVLSGYAEELQTPDPMRRELAQLRRERAEREAERKAAEEHQRQQQQQLAVRQDLYNRASDLVNFAPSAFPGVLRYAQENGSETFAADLAAIRQQMGGNVGMRDLLAEVEHRARIHYKLPPGDAAPPSAHPSQAKGPGQPAAPAAQAKPTGRRPVGVPQRAAAEASGEESFEDPAEYDRRAAAHLRAARSTRKAS